MKFLDLLKKRGDGNVEGNVSGTTKRLFGVVGGGNRRVIVKPRPFWLCVAITFDADDDGGGGADGR